MSVDLGGIKSTLRVSVKDLIKVLHVIKEEIFSVMSYYINVYI